jgi:hypothetical protein
MHAAHALLLAASPDTGFTWTPQALVAAVLVLVGGISAAAVQAAKGYRDVITVLATAHKDSAKAQVETAQAQTTLASAAMIASSPANGGGTGMKLPAWDQTTDIAVGGISATGQIDCGPECVAMCLRVLTGVQVPASYLRWLVKGPNDMSLTTADDLVQMFQVNEHHAHRRDAPFSALLNEVGNSVRAGKPGIILGRWLGPMGHWMCFENVDPLKGIFFRDPYGGPEYWVPWDRVQAQYEGTYVHVDERAAYAA